jgi:1,4-alpha-glucan branching enzyme/maltooligosyltrehalose trehalohydrolase
MPFGAEMRKDGSVRFRLWAPAAANVGVLISGLTDTLPMAAVDNGWFELVTAKAKAGSRYKFQVDGSAQVPDPASRFQPQDVHGPSEVIDPRTFAWAVSSWHGRRWEEAVIYELHVGTFSASGLFSGVQERLDYLVELGVTAIELMPVSDFPGRRNWGYDGVLPYAPDSSYGRPEDLKALIDAAHGKSLMVFLDVVYNHLGPEGNYLNAYAPQFFTARHKTPWGDGINFDGQSGRPVRDFVIHNALYWLTEYRFDGLRLDAVHAILDDSTPDILIELAETVRKTIEPERHIHLILENEANQASYLRPRYRSGLRRYEQGSDGTTRVLDTTSPMYYDAQWNDDIHHAMHVAVTNESDGYYSDYADNPIQRLGRCLTEGFGYQHDPSQYRGGEVRGEVSKDLPLSCFVSFLQNHDQIGNRATGDRITAIADHCAVKAAAAIYLLAPSPPMIFMGEEFAASTPFLFFCDFGKDLAKAVTEGRRNEFARFERFKNPESRCVIPDPNSVITFERSTLDWTSMEDEYYKRWLDLYRGLLTLRREKISPMLKALPKLEGSYELIGERGLSARWKSGTRATLHLLANLSGDTMTADNPPGEVFYSSGTAGSPWSVVWTIQS